MLSFIPASLAAASCSGAVLLSFSRPCRNLSPQQCRPLQHRRSHHCPTASSNSVSRWWLWMRPSKCFAYAAV
ncbi:hypothetical protein BKA62DRAFT_725629 [Auriculariales sp. MPI-PUGE-AT-0066]|nr:hypothetical protein BKA62DRAFT_725629 [Auriculariales sp. MPI-PUGE-AT-0066]